MLREVGVVITHQYIGSVTVLHRQNWCKGLVNQQRAAGLFFRDRRQPNGCPPLASRRLTGHEAQAADSSGRNTPHRGGSAVAWRNCTANCAIYSSAPARA